MLRACLLIGLSAGGASAADFPSRFLLEVDGDGYSTIMDFALTSEDMQWRVVIKCSRGSKNTQYWATANLEGALLNGRIDGRKSQTFVVDKKRMLLSISKGQCVGGRATIKSGLGE